MHIIVLIKQVLDPEIPARAFRVNREQRVPDVSRAPYVMSVFDGNALEVALKLKDTKGGDLTITVLSLGLKGTEDVLRRAMAVTADAAVLVSADAAGMDSAGKARVLAAAIRKLDPADLVLAGRQAADWEAGQVGAMVAEELGLPCVPFVSRITLDGPALKLRRDVDDGFQVVRLPGRAVVTVTNDNTNVLRTAKVKDAMMAVRKSICTWTLADLGLDPAGLADQAAETIDLSVPQPLTHAEMIQGDGASDKARALVRRMRELSVI